MTSVFPDSAARCKGLQRQRSTAKSVGQPSGFRSRSGSKNSCSTWSFCHKLEWAFVFFERFCQWKDTRTPFTKVCGVGWIMVNLSFNPLRVSFPVLFFCSQILWTVFDHDTSSPVIFVDESDIVWLRKDVNVQTFKLFIFFRNRFCVGLPHIFFPTNLLWNGSNPQVWYKKQKWIFEIFQNHLVLQLQWLHIY